MFKKGFMLKTVSLIQLFSFSFLSTITITPNAAYAASGPLSATVTVDCNVSQGELFRPEEYFNIAKQSTYPEAQAARPADIQFLNDQGLHTKIQRAWYNEVEVYNNATGKFDNYQKNDEYLAQVSNVCDELLVNLRTEKQIKEFLYTPEQIKPNVKEYIKHIKQNFPKVKYLEVFNEPDSPSLPDGYYLIKGYNPDGSPIYGDDVLTPDNLYSYYKVFYEAVNEVNAELNPEVPLQVGGPALYNFDLTWLKPFFDGYKNDPSPDKKLDFISYHGYLRKNATTGKYDFYKETPSMATDERPQLEAELSSRGISTDIPTFITESGMYPGPLTDISDKKGGAGLDQMRQAAGMASLAYWYANSSSKNFVFGWNVRHNGGNARKDTLVSWDSYNKDILGADGKKIVYSDKFTPFGNMREMQSKMKTTKVKATSDGMDSKGLGVYSLAAKDDTGVSLMVWNYQSANFGYRTPLEYNTAVNVSNLPSIFNGKNIRVKTYKINSTTSNYYFGSQDNCNLQMVEDKIIANNGSYNTSLYLDPNCLQLVVLEPVDTNVLLNNTFDDEVTGAAPSWTVTVAQQTYASIANVPTTVSRSVYLRDESSTNYAKISKAFAGQTGRVCASWSFMGLNSLAGNEFQLKSGATVAADVYIDSSGKLTANGVKIQDLSIGNWYNVSLVADTGAHQYDIYVNNNRGASGIAFSAPVSSLDTICIQTGAESRNSLYVDNVKVTQVLSSSDLPGHKHKKSSSGSGASVSTEPTPTPAPTPTPTPKTKPVPTPTPASTSTSVTDVKGHWAETAINKLVSLGAISGYGDGSFKPDDNITRAEFIKMLVKAFKLQDREGKTFVDTNAHWAKDFISTATAYGIVEGYDDEAFGPDDLITREQMAVMIYNISKISGAAGDAQFTDESELSSWAEAAVDAAKKNGIIEGYPDGSFKPQDNASRAEAVTIIVKALGKTK